MMLSERSRQDTRGMIPLMGNVQNRQIIDTESGFLFVRGWEVGGGGICSWGQASFWKIECSGTTQR